MNDQRSLGVADMFKLKPCVSLNYANVHCDHPHKGCFDLGAYLSQHISLDKCSSEQTFGKIDTNNWLNISPICCLLRDGTCSSTCHTC